MNSDKGIPFYFLSVVEGEEEDEGNLFANVKINLSSDPFTLLSNTEKIICTGKHIIKDYFENIARFPKVRFYGDSGNLIATFSILRGHNILSMNSRFGKNYFSYYNG